MNKDELLKAIIDIKIAAGRIEACLEDLRACVEKLEKIFGELDE